VLLGVAAAASVQITGALLVFTLLVIPAAAAHALTSRPSIGVVLSVGLALVITWLGLGVAYYSPYPIGFWTTTLAFAVFLAARVTAGRIA
jgi:zinc/manganese transport system permease protein